MINLWCMQKDRSETTLEVICLSFPACRKTASIKQLLTQIELQEVARVFCELLALSFFPLGTSCGKIHIFRNIWGQFITSLVITNTDLSV